MILCLFSSEPCSHLFIYYIYINDLGLSSGNRAIGKVLLACVLCRSVVNKQQAFGFFLFVCRQLSMPTGGSSKLLVFLVFVFSSCSWPASRSSSAAVGSRPGRSFLTRRGVVGAGDEVMAAASEAIQLSK